MKFAHSKNKSKGFTLVEVGIVILLLTLVTAAKLKEQSAELRSSIAKAQGQQLKVLNAGLYSYGMKHFQEIVNNTPVTGVAVTRAPTVNELVAIGELNSGFSANGYYGSGYVTSIAPAPVGCVPSACNIAGLVYLNQPINDPFTGNVDGPSIGDAVLQIGADGGSSLRVPGTIQGANGGWSVANPLGATRGILAARSGLGSELDLTGYYKRDGSLPMSGDVDMGTNSITNIKTVVEGAACATAGSISRDASGAVLSCQGGIQKRQGSNYWQDPVNTAAALPTCNATTVGQTRIVYTPTVGTGARAYTCNGGTWQALGINDGGDFTVPDLLTVGKTQYNDIVNIGTACASDGLVARDSAGMLLSCQTGTWKNATSSSGSGLTGMLSPMKGKTISCSAISGGGTARAYAQVTPSGTVMAYCNAGNGAASGWVTGLSAGAASGGYYCTATVTATGVEGAFQYGAAYATYTYCSGNWPLN